MPNDAVVVMSLAAQHQRDLRAELEFFCADLADLTAKIKGQDEVYQRLAELRALRLTSDRL